MDEPGRSRPLFTLLTVVILIGGGIYFASHYQVDGLDQLVIQRRAPAPGDPPSGESVAEDRLFADRGSDFGTGFHQSPFSGTGFSSTEAGSRPAVFRTAGQSDPDDTSTSTVAAGRGRAGNLRVASWALSGFGPSKLANDACRSNLVRLIRQFDLISLQQITAAERDLIPRLVDAVNEGGRSYDFVMGAPTGPEAQTEQLAILFDVQRLHVDRSQTYTIADPHQKMTFDPMVAWFRVAGIPVDSAWTFSVVNVRVNLARAAAEVALLPGIFSSVRLDGRGEDDVVMTGLFQADDSYMIPRILGSSVTAAVRSAPTDIFGRHQTCNILVDRQRTSEYLGRGGPVDFLRHYNLSIGQAETISSHLPVFAEFTATEGGFL
ncbi:deoxyribonuclease I [Roseiconus nitratireducens]|uniref:Deoxyribonuclease I n=1 Tax=Roseiconus nitratireducens TaxID=2605748 RepID=A0A5M6D1V4_9BACT|nr:deoxyribonuclease I [Roseiconus nitratireducens]KAA5540986.1 deoxyribonuclease I [Roseiconus nitratireducens]